MISLTISIALCTYNGEKFLLEQLQSFLDQTRQPDELVVCDDHSSDRTLEILDEFAKRAPFPVRINVNETNLGSTKNFEKVISLCHGDIIFLSDQDDVWFPDKLARMVAMFQEDNGVGAVFSDGDIVGPQLASLGYRLWDTFSFTLSEQKRFRSGEAVEVLLKRNVITGATMAFRSKFRSLVLPIPRSWIHDGWISFLIAAVARIEFIAEPTIKYRQHANNQIGGLRKSLIKEIKIATSSKGTSYFSVVEQYDQIKNRLFELNNKIVLPQVLKLINEKSEHFRIRAQMPSNFFEKLKIVRKEFVLSRYRHYSGGYKSLLKDIF